MNGILPGHSCLALELLCQSIEFCGIATELIPCIRSFIHKNWHRDRLTLEGPNLFSNCMSNEGVPCTQTRRRQSLPRLVANRSHRSKVPSRAFLPRTLFCSPHPHSTKQRRNRRGNPKSQAEPSQGNWGHPCNHPVPRKHNFTCEDEVSQLPSAGCNLIATFWTRSSI